MIGDHQGAEAHHRGERIDHDGDDHRVARAAIAPSLAAQFVEQVDAAFESDSDRQRRTMMLA